jgi:hypothetical protein
LYISCCRLFYRSKKMKRLMVAVLIATMVLTMSVTVYAKKEGAGQSGKSNTGHLYLREKDPATWEMVDDGAWGKMKYNLSGPEFGFVFNGHGLEPEEEYTLIYYPDPWPGTGLICLGSGVADEDGNVHIKESVDTGDMPADSDENDGAKIWLVLSGDVDCDDDDPQIVGWQPEEYLFEYDLITFDDTDDTDDDEVTVLPAPGGNSATTTWGNIRAR